MKMPGSLSKLLTNRYVLYLVALLALFNVIGYMMMNKTQIVILFILIGYLMTHFSKNMVIVLLVPLVLVNLLTSGMMMKEGFSEGGPGSAEDRGGERGANQPMDGDTKDSKGKSESESESKSASASKPASNSEPAGAPPKKEDFSSAGGRKGASRVDMGSTLEQAYDDLNSVLGSDGIKNLTSDTQNLMKQQLHLAEAMKEMGPLMQQAQSMLKTLNIDGIGDIPSLMKKFGVNATALPTPSK
jgi:hypothetical protein